MYIFLTGKNIFICYTFYSNVIEENFLMGNSLKFSSMWDIVMSTLVEDIDRDGENEIIVGTFGCVSIHYHT